MHRKTHKVPQKKKPSPKSSNKSKITTRFSPKRSTTSKPQVDISSLPAEIRQYVTQKTPKPQGMYGVLDNNTLFNLGATINAPVDAESWIYNLGSGAHPAAIWTTAPFSLPTSQLAPDGYHDPCLSAAPKPYSARMWGSGEISWKTPMFIGGNILQVASIENPPQFKRGKNGDFLLSTYTNRWCDAENPTNVAAEETVNYIHRDPKNKIKPHVRDENVPQPTEGVDYDFERQSLDLTEAVLFRYSAVTWNTSEGYKDLLVHGPLQATLALDLLGAVSQAICPEEPPLSGKVYHALNSFHHQEERRQLQQQHSHSHSHSHGGKACSHDHGGGSSTPQIRDEDLTDLPKIPWHVRFHQLTHFGYELKQPLYVNTPVRVLAKVQIDDFDYQNYEQQQLLHQQNRGQGLPAKVYAMKDLLRDKQAYVKVWIQDAEDPSLIYFNSTACFDTPNVIHYNQVPEKGLDMLLKDLQEKKQ
jgi:hypothetical protein